MAKARDTQTPEKPGYLERMHRELKALEAELDTLVNKAKVSEAEVRTRLIEQGNELARKRDEVEASLRKLADAGEERWHEARDEVEHVWKAFRNSVHYFKSHFK